MIEKTNVSGFDRVEDGRYRMNVVGVPEKVETAKSSFRKWIFDVELPDSKKEIQVIMFPWESKELLIACGGKETGNYVEWDDEKVDSKCVSADLKTEKYVDKNDKEKLKYVLGNFEEESPF